MARTVLVTGAGRGLGIHLAEALLESGFQVFAGRREPSAALQALERKSDGRLRSLLLDVSDPSLVRAAAAQVAAEAPSLDVLVNNAAILPEASRGPLESVDVEAGHRVHDVNALGPLRVTQAFIALLRRGEMKLLVNVSSEAGSIGDCWRKEEFHYCMSKAALNMQTAILRNYLGPEGFRLLAVHPGWLRTDMGGSNAHLDPRDAARALVELIVAPRSANDPFYVDHTGQELRF